MAQSTCFIECLCNHQIVTEEIRLLLTTSKCTFCQKEVFLGHIVQRYRLLPAGLPQLTRSKFSNSYCRFIQYHATMAKPLQQCKSTTPLGACLCVCACVCANVCTCVCERDLESLNLHAIRIADA